MPNYIEILQKASDWDVLPTTQAGIFLTKLPANRTQKTRLFAMINPLSEAGTPLKKRGFMIRNQSELNALRKLVLNPKLDELITELETQQGTITDTKTTVDI